MQEIATIKTDVALIKQYDRAQTTAMEAMRKDNKEFKDLLLDTDKGLLTQQNKRIDVLERWKDKLKGAMGTLGLIFGGGGVVYLVFFVWSCMK